MTTQFIINNGGIELNPILAPIICHLLILKIICIFIISGIAIWSEKWIPGTSPLLFCGASCITGLAFFWNMHQIFGIPIL